MKTLLTLSFFIIAVSGIAQDKPVPVNYDSVKLAVTDPEKDTYYPKLLQRFNHFDTTLTLQDYRLLYYGYAFDAGYSPYYNDGTMEIAQFVKKRKYDKALEICDRILAKNPTALATNSYKGFVLMNMAENDSTRRYAIRYKKMLDAILSSGDGLTCETAFKVIYVSDEYTLLRDVFEANPHGRRTNAPCDRFSIGKAKNYTASTIYFDYSADMIYFKQKFPDKK
jgi:hypothetical protein